MKETNKKGEELIYNPRINLSREKVPSKPKPSGEKMANEMREERWNEMSSSSDVLFLNFSFLLS